MLELHRMIFFPFPFWFYIMFKFSLRCLILSMQVTDVRTDLSQIGYDLETLQKLVCGLVSFVSYE